MMQIIQGFLSVLTALGGIAWCTGRRSFLWLVWWDCEFLLAPDFGQLMRDPTSLFTSFGFPRGCLCLRCSRVPFVLPVLSVLPWCRWEGIRLLLCLHYACSIVSYRLRLLLFRILFVLSLVSILVLLSQLPILSVLPCLAFLLAQPSSAVLPPLSVCSLSELCLSGLRACPLSSVQNAVLYVLGEFFRIPCGTRLLSLQITSYFLWISSDLLCTNTFIYIALSLVFSPFFLYIIFL